MSFTLCAGASSEGEVPLTEAQLNQLSAAARQARARRASPADPRETIHAAPDVACPAWLMWTPAQRDRLRARLALRDWTLS